MDELKETLACGYDGGEGTLEDGMYILQLMREIKEQVFRDPK